jgi:Ca2+/H+ antiporter, TMEM165/GDT1 family
MNGRRLLKGLKIAAMVAVAAAAFGFVVMSLWNWLAPTLFGLHAITFWQALGLLILSKILFGGFRGRPGGGYAWRRANGRWQKMTPEEREQFRQVMFGGCGRPGTAAEPSPNR